MSDLFTWIEEENRSKKSAIKVAEEDSKIVKDDDKVMTVFELTRSIKNLVESGFNNIWVEGEISNFKKHSSGHCYFSIKDEKSVINCVMWRSVAERISGDFGNGNKVIINGKVTIFEAGGKYQIEVKKLELSGIGTLQQQFEELKQKLLNEGLFDISRKRKIPSFVKNIGVVTAETGAAFQDIRKVLGNRAPFINIYLFNARVQGEGAKEEIANGIRVFNQFLPDLDVLIVGRGGGSLEDLWPFNEEIVARAISSSKIPVISAVGHEIDFSISDFCADLRAATPSHAAELSSIDVKENLQFFNNYQKRIENSIVNFINRQKDLLKNYENSHAFLRPQDTLKNHIMMLDINEERINLAYINILVKERRLLDNFSSLLESLGPKSILNRGYSVVRKEGKSISDSSDLLAGDKVEIIFSKGVSKAQIE
ncbi:MAG: exodeoxyribonuclease VII large subunit [Candidatus Delongbacteria bacterium]|nr:exodeoxyribonuclease VII large subunit [Candidatus Delongbacteria bacterium]MBN2834644.1 exodeoxyribonuclease VII large subunit [Candidatus Delongbacteria bacterium]